jgi:hypothetical protein
MTASNMGKSIRRQQANDGVPTPYTGEGFVIETSASGKLSVYFKNGVVEWHKPACTDVQDILEDCVEMARLQAELQAAWQKINVLGATHGFQLTDSFCANGLI